VEKERLTITEIKRRLYAQEFDHDKSLSLTEAGVLAVTRTILGDRTDLDSTVEIEQLNALSSVAFTLMTNLARFLKITPWQLLDGQMVTGHEETLLTEVMRKEKH
jgi:hypothetical protein